MGGLGSGGHNARSDRKDRHCARKGLQAKPDRPSYPKWLEPEAKREWRRLAPLTVKLGPLTPLDRAALAAFCTLWARYVTAEPDLTKFTQARPRWSEKQAL